VPAPPKPDQNAPRPASPTGVTNGQRPDPDPRAQAGEFLTTAQGLRLPDTDHPLKAGARGPTLLEDFHSRGKITHFDHERIPARVVYARGAAAHGVFESYGNAASVSKAGFLGKKGTKTEVFTRFRPCSALEDPPTRSAGRAGSDRRTQDRHHRRCGL
jgi:catalase